MCLAETHLPQFGRGQSRVEVARPEKDSGQTAVGHCALGDLRLYIYIRTPISKIDMPQARVRTA